MKRRPITGVVSALALAAAVTLFAQTPTPSGGAQPPSGSGQAPPAAAQAPPGGLSPAQARLRPRSEEHTSELQSHDNLVCRLLLEKKKYQPLYSQTVRPASTRPTKRY